MSQSRPLLVPSSQSAHGFIRPPEKAFRGKQHAFQRSLQKTASNGWGKLNISSSILWRRSNMCRFSSSVTWASPMKMTNNRCLKSKWCQVMPVPRDQAAQRRRRQDQGHQVSGTAAFLFPFFHNLKGVSKRLIIAQTAFATMTSTTCSRPWSWCPRSRSSGGGFLTRGK